MIEVYMKERFLDVIYITIKDDNSNRMQLKEFSLGAVLSIPSDLLYATYKIKEMFPRNMYLLI
jgi:hypothetical protein